MGAVSEQTKTIMRALGAFGEFGTDRALWEALRRPEACDFMFGNPHDVAPQAYVDALVRGAQPTGQDHYAYTMNLPEAAAAIAAGLRGSVRARVRRRGRPPDERELRRARDRAPHRSSTRATR